MTNDSRFNPLGLQATDIAALIAADSAAKPRTQQRTPGPSTLGHPCARHIGYQHTGADKITLGGDVLPSWIGTEAHAGMQRILDALPEWEAEIGVELTGYGISGTVDAYHRPSATVADWKFVGASAMTRYKANGPGEQYRTQAHLYGLGLSLAGYEVRTVAVVFIPRSGLSSGIHLWSEPWDEAVCETALRRYEAIGTVSDNLGVVALPTSADAKCEWCPWYQPGAPTTAASCSGHEPPTVTGTVTDQPLNEGARA